jgi:hypothetical protein
MYNFYFRLDYQQQYVYNVNGGVFKVVRARILKRRQLGQSNSVVS